MQNYEVFKINIIDIFGQKVDTRKAMQMNILTLAYLGDVVQDMFIRSRVTIDNPAKINQIHRTTVKYVNANSQADCMDLFMDELTEEEMAIFKRGRNSKSMPTKNTDRAHYVKATGFEAVLGFLYISGQDERLLYILNKSFNFISERSGQ